MSLYLACPDCGSRDAVPKRVIVHSRLRRRWWWFGPIVAVPEVVGNVHLCSRCACEWCAGPQGAWVPRAGAPAAREHGSEAGRPREPDVRSLRDADQPWA